MKNLLLGAAFLTATMSQFAQAETVEQIQQSAFQAGAGLITFSEVPIGTTNPSYMPSMYGGGAGSPSVTFGGYFSGQMLGTSGTCPAGAALTGCVIGNPTPGTLSIDPTSPATFTSFDGAMPTAPVLSGSPIFNGPIAIKFSTPQSGVGLIGGYFDSVASTAITVYDASGNVIGQLANNQTGDEFLGLVTADGLPDISGIEFSLVGDEPFGFDIDNVEFGIGAQVVVPNPVPNPTPTPMPEPGTLGLLATGLAILGLGMRYKRG